MTEIFSCDSEFGEGKVSFVNENYSCHYTKAYQGMPEKGFPYGNAQGMDED